MRSRKAPRSSNWFDKYPYPYIHPDSSLWYLIAMGHFYHFTGDEEFVRQSWPHILEAYRYCLSIMDPADGLLVIPKEAWGSMELTGFSKDAAMAGEWIAALHAMRDLARMAGDSALSEECDQREEKAAASLEREFWDPQLEYYDYGLFTSGEPVTYLNPAIGWSAWLGSLPREPSTNSSGEAFDCIIPGGLGSAEHVARRPALHRGFVPHRLSVAVCDRWSHAGAIQV